MLALMLTLSACASISAVELSADEAAATALSAETSGFSDVSADADYAQAVAWCREKGILNGVSGDRFDPEGTLTRAMAAVAIYRAAGEPAAGSGPAFPDTPADAWYGDAVAWASEKKMVHGYGNGLFGPYDPVSVRQLEVIVGRYLGKDPALDGDPAKAKPATRAQVAAALYNALKDREENAMKQITLSFNGHTYSATLADNSSARAFAELLKSGPLTVSAHDYGSFEKVGELGRTLPRNDEHITTSPGDIILYQGNQITVYYAQNSWSFTRLGRIDDPGGLREALGDGNVEITFRLADDKGDTGPFDLAAGQVILNSGYVMPINGLGTYSLHGDECVNAVKAALKSGVRLFDTASAYGNEKEVGQAICEGMEELGIKREEVFIITKIYPGSEMADPETSIQACLDRLDLGYVDMMLLHHPDPNGVKAYKAMEKFVENGKIRSLGLSNWYVKELKDLLPQVTIKPALVQNEIHPYYQENDVIPYIQEQGITAQGWYPLGGRGHTAELLGDETISAIAAAHGVSSAQVILRWNLQKGVVVIPGSSDPDHIQENTELYHFELTEEEMAQINALDRGEKHDWY